LNRNSLPFYPNGPRYTSGLRIGAAEATTLGMGCAEMEELGAIIALVLKGVSPAPPITQASYLLILARYVRCSCRCLS
jgi:glycine hydroxymethyltransferase